MAPERKKRPTPSRTGPQRNGGGIPGFGASHAPAADKDSAPYTLGRAFDRTLETAQRVVDAVDITARDAVERGVETAYTVVDEYVRRGQAAASRRHMNSSGDNHMNNDRGAGNGGYTGAPWGGAPWANAPWMTGAAAANPFLGPWMQMMRMWSDSMMTFMPSGSAAANPFAAMMSATLPQTRVAVRLASRRPAKVTVAIDAGAQLFALRADPLCLAGDAKAPDIAPPTIEAGSDITVRVSIPDDQPAGRYEAAIRDGAGASRGQLIVELDAA